VARRWCLRLVCPIRRGGSAPGRVEELGAWMTGVRGYAMGNEIENMYHDAASFTGDLGEAYKLLNQSTIHKHDRD
jgi:hypothetical protein